ncbi:HPP family protein [Galbitalea sp. SE-J8]|uniref:HPP family protein n=1 Tax=Galbitalea sp. SE-J8 TaxID=3054952 RepID=UPI00259D2AB5|nr:HPP family protein [Galbitalea sp. SE-J8]MDM4763015.1 HPP family protein [Galbitalea sp. SE-J8]
MNEPSPPPMEGGTLRARVWQRIRPAQSALPWHTVVAASVSGAITIAILGAAGDVAGTPILIAAFGSSCVLVFLLPDAPLSKPINVVGGHLIAALCGLAVHELLPTTWWSLGLSVGIAMAAMAAARVIHPPAGGTPIAILLAHEGWSYLVTPVLVGALVLSACALTYRLVLTRFQNRARTAGAGDEPGRAS